jgi:hypothetical protein
MRISIKQFNRAKAKVIDHCEATLNIEDQAAVIDQVSMALHRMDSGNVDTVLIEVIR